MTMGKQEHPDPNQSDETIVTEGMQSPMVENLPAGTAIDRFQIISQIGSGGMGVVYKAYDPKLNRGVALKLIRADQATLRQSQDRLLREAQALARLSHPNVLHVYDVGTFEEKVFMTTALVEGLTLNAWLKVKQRNVDEILGVMMAAGKGLSAAHKAGLIHRDFKPRNVMIGVDGQVRVLDFGLARAVCSEGNDEYDTDVNVDTQDKELSSKDSADLLQTPLTQTGHVLGTPLYMAPEQHFGIKTDERTDQFGFCFVLYEALYNRRPFAARTLDELRSEVSRHQVVVPRADTNVPNWLWQVVKRGLSANRNDRFASMGELLDELARDPMQENLQKRMALKRKLYLFGVVLLSIGLPISIWYGLRYRTLERCKSTEAEFAGVWDRPAQASVQKAFLNIEKPYSQWTWKRVKAIFGKYLTSWTQMRSDVCEARLIRGTQSEELFDLRMSCLKSRMQEFKALIAVFAKADTGVVHKAVEASTSLTHIDICADEKALRAPYPPPKTAQVKEKVASIREKLAAVEALTKTGQYREGLVLVKKLEKQSNRFKYKPLQAEVLCKLGWLLDRVGEYKNAESTLYKAVQASGESRAALLVAKAMTGLVWVVGYAQGRPNDGLLIGRDADSVIALAGGNDPLRADLLNNMGVLFWSQGEYKKALDHYHQALVISKRTLGHSHPDVARSYGNLAIIHFTQKEYQKALEYYREALATFERVLGPEHPDGASTLNNIGEVFRELGENAKALKYYAKALTINERALGPEHRFVAQSLYNMGEVFREQKEYQKALEHYRKALAILEKALGPEHPKVASTLNNIGHVFREQGDDQKALEHYRRALLILNKTLGSE